MCALKQVDCLLGLGVLVAVHLVHTHFLAHTVLIGFKVLQVLLVHLIRGLHVIVRTVLGTGRIVFLLFSLHFLLQSLNRIIKHLGRLTDASVLIVDGGDALLVFDLLDLVPKILWKLRRTKHCIQGAWQFQFNQKVLHILFVSSQLPLTFLDDGLCLLIHQLHLIHHEGWKELL